MGSTRHLPAARVLIACMAAASMTATLSAANDWPHFGGIDRNCVSTESGWSSEGREADVWRTNVGIGYSSVSIVDGRLYTIGFNGDLGADVVYCLDAVSGREIWTHSYPMELDDKFHRGGSLTTPSVDGDRVYVSSRNGMFFCFNAEDGEVLWSRNLTREHDLERPTWGFAASPLVLDDAVVMNVGRVISFDKRTGEPTWETRDYGHAYAVPVLFEHEGSPKFAVFNGDGLIVIDQATGQEHATHGWKTEYDVNAAAPIIIGNQIFISSGYNHGCAMLRFTGDALETVWESRALRSQMQACVHYGDNIYGFDDSVLKCIDLEGNETWRKRGLGKGALVASDGRLIIVSGRGDLVIAQASPGEYNELSKVNVFPKAGECWTIPVLVDGRIYARNSFGELVCRDHRAQ